MDTHETGSAQIEREVEEQRRKVEDRIGEIRERLVASGADVNDIDGVRVTDEDGWWLLRASNTQDVLVARCESETSEGLERLKAALVSQLKQSGIEPPASL